MRSKKTDVCDKCGKKIPIVGCGSKRNKDDSLSHYFIFGCESCNYLEKEVECSLEELIKYS